MIKHLFTIIRNEQKSNLWLICELFLASVCLWFVIDYMVVLTGITNTPLGYNIDHTYRIDLEEKLPGADNYIDPSIKESTTGEDILAIMERLNQYPGIEWVSLSKASQPYVATHYTNLLQYRQLYYNDTIGITAQEYRVTPSFFMVFQNKPTLNENMQLANSLKMNSVILAENAVEKLIGAESPINKTIQIGNKGDIKQVEALCTPVRWSEYFKSNPAFYILLTEREIAENIHSGNLSNYELCVRVSPEADEGFAETFTEKMIEQLGVGNLYLVDIRHTSVIRKAVVAPEESDIRSSVALFAFVIINVFLGISGTFVFRTQYRRSEIGLRMALGSSKKSVRQLIKGEGLLLLTIAFIPAIVVALNMGIGELVNTQWVDFTGIRFLIGIGITYFILVVMILIGIWYPVRKTMSIQPAVVLHEE